MMRHRARFLRCHLWLAAALLAPGCRDALSPGTRLPRPARNEVLVRLVVSPDETAGTYVVHVVTKRGVTFQAPTAFQASLRLPVGVTFVDDASQGSTYLRAMNAVEGVLLVAGAAAQGDAGDELFAVRVRSVDPTRPSQIELRVVEFRDRSGRDQRPALRILQPYRETRR